MSYSAGYELGRSIFGGSARKHKAPEAVDAEKAKIDQMILDFDRPPRQPSTSKELGLKIVLMLFIVMTVFSQYGGR
jgi:hypothetical protein